MGENKGAELYFEVPESSAGIGGLLAANPPQDVPTPKSISDIATGSDTGVRMPCR